MKKVIHLLCFLLLTTGCDYDKGSLVEEESIQNDNLNKLLHRTNNTNPLTLQELIDLDLKSKLNIITYVVGATLIREIEAKNQIEDMLIIDNKIDLSYLLFYSNSNEFRREYRYILLNLINFNKNPIDPSGELEVDDFLGLRDYNSSDTIDFDSFMTLFHNNCFELYFPVPLDLFNDYNNNLIIGIPHPLTMSPFDLNQRPISEVIYPEEVSNVAIMELRDVNQNILQHNSKNIFVTRLSNSSRACDYSEVGNDFDFTSFLNTD